MTKRIVSSYRESMQNMENEVARCGGCIYKWENVQAANCVYKILQLYLLELCNHARNPDMITVDDMENLKTYLNENNNENESYEWESEDEDEDEDEFFYIEKTEEKNPSSGKVQTTRRSSRSPISSP